MAWGEKEGFMDRTCQSLFLSWYTISKLLKGKEIANNRRSWKENPDPMERYMVKV